MHDGSEVTVPKAVNDSLQHRLTADLSSQSPNGHGGQVMLSVYNQEGGLSIVLAHDMDPNNPGSTEWHATNSGSLRPNETEALKAAMRDFVRAEGRNPLRLTCGRETRVSEAYVRRVLPVP